MKKNYIYTFLIGFCIIITVGITVYVTKNFWGLFGFLALLFLLKNKGYRAVCPKCRHRFLADKDLENINRKFEKYNLLHFLFSIFVCFQVWWSYYLGSSVWSLCVLLFLHPIRFVYKQFSTCPECDFYFNVVRARWISECEVDYDDESFDEYGYRVRDNLFGCYVECPEDDLAGEEKWKRVML